MLPRGAQIIRVDGIDLTADGDYQVALSKPTIPAAAAIGDSGLIGRYNDYTDPTQSTPIFTTTYSYVLVADTPPSAATAVLQLTIAQAAVGPNAFLTGTNVATYRWRIDTSGNPTFLSVATQVSQGFDQFEDLYTCASGC